MKKFLLLAALLFPLQANATISGPNIPDIIYTSPDTKENIAAIPGVCEVFSRYADGNTGDRWMITSCAGTPVFARIWPLDISSIINLTSTLAGKFNSPTGTSSQYIKGDGTYGTYTGPVTRTFNYPTRALNSCFQISTTQDAEFHYKVDVTTGLSLTTGAQGTVTATSYTNSGCTTGAQAIADGTASQTGTLVIGLGVNQTISAGIDGMLPAGKWMKITTANTVGTPTFAIRTVQSEILE